MTNPVALRAGIPPLKGRKLRYYMDKWMVTASSIAPPPVAERPLDPSIARRSLAIIAAAEAPEMSDEDALNGIDFARLVGFPLDGLPDDADPHKATAFFESLGLSADFTGMDFDAAPAPASADDDAAKTHSGDGGHVAV